MGNSDKYVIPFYKEKINPIISPVALLGFSGNKSFDGDLYDLSLGNWEINSAWKLPKKYDTIICTRCAYFAKKPEDFILRCYDSLEDGGLLYVDWGLGNHWRFDKFKVGWVKEGEHEFCYSENNYLWSTVWNNRFLENDQCFLFEEEIKKYGYDSLNQAVLDEVPAVLKTTFIESLFDTSYNFLTIVSPYLQLYILVSGVKK